MRDISKNIRALRTAKGLTQEELAAALHVTRQTVSNYENGRSRPDIDMVLRIAQALETDANDVLYGPPVPPDRRRERRRILLGLAVTAGLAVLAWACWGPALAWGALVYLHAAVFPIRLVLVPCCAAVGGWTLMAAVGQLLRAEPLSARRRPWVRWARRGLTAVLALLLATVVPFVIWDVWSYVVPIPPEGRSSSFAAGCPLYAQLTTHIVVLLLRLPWATALLGAAVWLLGWPRERAAAATPPTDEKGPTQG